MNLNGALIWMKKEPICFLEHKIDSFSYQPNIQQFFKEKSSKKIRLLTQILFQHGQFSVWTRLFFKFQATCIPTWLIFSWYKRTAAVVENSWDFAPSRETNDPICRCANDKKISPRGKLQITHHSLQCNDFLLRFFYSNCSECGKLRAERCEL